MKKTHIYGTTLEYNPKDKSITVNGKRFDAQYMSKANKEYNGVNRIHKPFALLFWSDCKNGKYSNWQTS